MVIDYEPLLGEHLPLKKGETVIVLEREKEREGSASPTSNLGEAEGARDEMWKGKIGDAVGWFPAKNVEQVPLDEMNLSEDEREEAVKQSEHHSWTTHFVLQSVTSKEAYMHVQWHI